MHKPESILENEILKILKDFDIRKFYQILARRSDLVIVNKKETLPNSGLCRGGGPLTENQRK